MNRKILKITILVLALFVLPLLASCFQPPQKAIMVSDVNRDVESCTGKMLTLDEMKEKKANLEQISKYYEGKNIHGDEIETDEEEEKFGVVALYWSAELECDEPDDYEITENTRFDITTLEKDEKTGIYRGIKITAYEIGVPSETTETTVQIEETTTESEGMTVDAYKEYIKGWWVNEEDHKTVCYTDMFDTLSLLGLNIDYSIDSETTGLKVSVTGEAKDGTIADAEYIFIYIDDNCMSFYIPSSGETICERTTAPEEST